MNESACKAMMTLPLGALGDDSSDESGDFEAPVDLLRNELLGLGDNRSHSEQHGGNPRFQSASQHTSLPSNTGTIAGASSTASGLPTMGNLFPAPAPVSWDPPRGFPTIPAMNPVLRTSQYANQGNDDDDDDAKEEMKAPPVDFDSLGDDSLVCDVPQQPVPPLQGAASVARLPERRHGSDSGDEGVMGTSTDPGRAFANYVGQTTSQSKSTFLPNQPTAGAAELKSDDSDISESDEEEDRKPAATSNNDITEEEEEQKPQGSEVVESQIVTNEELAQELGGDSSPGSDKQPDRWYSSVPIEQIAEESDYEDDEDIKYPELDYEYPQADFDADMASVPQTNERGKKAVESWANRFRQLSDFRRRHGHCRVPQKYERHKGLGHWVNKIRQEKRDREKNRPERGSILNDRRLLHLEKIGFEWAKPKGDESWKNSLKKLKSFKEERGHCNVPTKWEEDTALGRWVSSQRNEKKKKERREKNKLDDWKIEQLELLGFSWEVPKGPQEGTKMPRKRGRKLYTKKGRQALKRIKEGKPKRRRMESGETEEMVTEERESAEEEATDSNGSGSTEESKDEEDDDDAPSNVTEL